MKSWKHALTSLTAALLLAPALTWAEKPGPEACPCWLEDKDYGMAAAVDEIDGPLPVLNWVNLRQPDDILSELWIEELRLPYQTETEQNISAIVKFNATKRIGSCEVTIYDKFLEGGIKPRQTAYGDLDTIADLNSCLSGIRLMRLTAKEWLYTLGPK
jgi:hypothetical protein